MRIDGKKIYLTSFTYDDCEDFIRWRNSDFIQSRFIYRKEITIEQQREWVKNKIETGEVAQFIIWDKQDNKKIGSVYLQHIDNELKQCEFGILIGEEQYTGAGRGREANLLICDYGFNVLGMHKIYLRVLASNTLAKRSYENAGYKEEYTSHDDVWIDGEPVDVLFMSKFKELES